MKQVHEDICVPKGFAAAGTYSGVCRNRVKVDLAMIVSTKAGTIVTSTPSGVTTAVGSAVLFHNGAALPKGARASEIKQEICAAAATKLHCPCGDVQFVAHGVSGQFFRPSLVVHSLPALLAGLSADASDDVRRVVDTLGDVTSEVVTVTGTQGLCHMGGIAADGTNGQNGLCVITTDGSVTAGAIEKALSACRASLDTGAYTFIVMANGMAPNSSVSEGELTRSLQHLLKDLGFTKALQECS